MGKQVAGDTHVVRSGEARDRYGQGGGSGWNGEGGYGRDSDVECCCSCRIGITAEVVCCIGCADPVAVAGYLLETCIAVGSSRYRGKKGKVADTLIPGSALPGSR